MISVRFGEELEKLVEQAAEARGMSVSAFIRETVAREVAAKPKTLAERLSGIAGSLRGDGTSAVAAKKRLGEIMAADHDQRPNRRRRQASSQSRKQKG